jgi:hypothetical protein
MEKIICNDDQKNSNLRARKKRRVAFARLKRYCLLLVNKDGGMGERRLPHRALGCN